MRAGEAAVEVLRRAGVRRFYTVPGESFLEVLDAAERSSDITLVSTRHESGASFMAEADAKLTGTPAVALATRGVGASNLAIGVHTARQDSTPMVVLLGQVETQRLGREAFQEVDLPDFYREITKSSATVHRPERLPEMVAEAFRIAVSGRPGPVMLALPADVLGEEINLPDERSEAKSARAPALKDVRKVLEALAGASRPVAIAGELSKDAGEGLISFAEHFGVGVYTAFRRQDHFPNAHPNYLGHLTLGTPPETLEAFESADLILSLGCRLDETTTQSYTLPRAGQPVVEVHPDPETLARTPPARMSVVSEVKEVLEALLSNLPDGPNVRRDWSAAHRAYLRASEVPPSRSEGGVDPARVVRAMSEVLPEDAVVASDAGNFSTFLHRYYRYKSPKTQLAPANGAMGYGLPAAVAAGLACPGKTVVSVSGDGGFLMTGQELETAVRYGLSLAAVVFRNGLHGTIAAHQARKMGRTAGVEIGGVDLAAFARSLGAEGISVREPEEVEGALRQAVQSEGVTLVDVVTDPDLISPAAKLSELMGGV